MYLLGQEKGKEVEQDRTGTGAGAGKSEGMDAGVDGRGGVGAGSVLGQKKE